MATKMVATNYGTFIIFSNGLFLKKKKKGSCVCFMATISSSIFLKIRRNCLVPGLFVPLVPFLHLFVLFFVPAGGCTFLGVSSDPWFCTKRQSTKS